MISTDRQQTYGMYLYMANIRKRSFLYDHLLFLGSLKFICSTYIQRDMCSSDKKNWYRK